MSTTTHITAACVETATDMDEQERIASRCATRRGVRVRSFGTLYVTRREARDDSGESPGYGPRDLTGTPGSL